MPPLMKGNAARMKGVWRKSVVAFLGFSAAFDIAFDASLSTASEDCFAFSRARAAGILNGEEAVTVVDMVVSQQVCLCWAFAREVQRYGSVLYFNRQKYE